MDCEACWKMLKHVDSSFQSVTSTTSSAIWKALCAKAHADNTRICEAGKILCPLARKPFTQCLPQRIFNRFVHRMMVEAWHLIESMIQQAKAAMDRKIQKL